MKIKDNRIQGGPTLIEPVMAMAFIVLIIVGLFTFYFAATDAKKVNKLSHEVDVSFQKMVIGENKENYVIKKVESSEFCSALITKQKDWWSSIEVENKLVDTSKKIEIYKACLLDQDEINIKFSNPILKKEL